MPLKQVISGGQTGVDQAALDAAIGVGIPHGGWCSKGRLCESGITPKKYNLLETDSADVSERTIRNIEDSDATLIIVEAEPITVADGTQLALKTLKEQTKPYLIIALDAPTSIEAITDWIEQHTISKLNIAGPRESLCPGIYQKAYDLLKSLFLFVHAQELKNRH